MGRRIVLVVAALLVAALGTALVWMYANRADERAQAGTEQVQVLVATTGIPAGTTGAAISEAASVQLTTLPAASVPAGALSDLTPVQSLVTIASVFQGQVLLEPMFGTQVESSGGLTLEEGQMAVSVSMGDPQRVAGFLSPGSEVAIFLTGAGLSEPAAAPEGAESEEGEGAAPETETAVLLERVKVIAVGPTTLSQTTTTTDGTAGETTNTEEIPTAILTLALDQSQAQRVIHATTAGSMYFALLNADSKVDPAQAGTTNANILD